jgi:hypothetical protein
MSSSWSRMKRCGGAGLTYGITFSSGGSKMGCFSCTVSMSRALTASSSSSALLVFSWIETLGALWKNFSRNSSSTMKVAPSMAS